MPPLLLTALLQQDGNALRLQNLRAKILEIFSSRVIQVQNAKGIIRELG